MTRKSNSRLAVLVLALVMSLGLAAAAGASERMVPKVDAFVLFVDHSGSMMMRHAETGQRKIEMAKEFLAKLNQAIPELGYQSAMATFAPYALRQAPQNYDKAGLAEAVEGLETDYGIFGRQTAMGRGLASLDAVAGEMDKPLAVILVSDGLHNLGEDPVARAQEMYDVHTRTICFHVVSLADEPKGRAVLDGIAALKGCSVKADAVDLMADQAALDQFVRDVFYDVEVEQEMVKEAETVVQEQVVAETVEEVITFRSVTFDFDSAAIREDMAPILDQAAEILAQRQGELVVSGHTCNLGPEAYNMDLSLRRAESVRDYLVGRGIDKARFRLAGYGENQPKFDNDTREGRRLNRRVEITLD